MKTFSVKEQMTGSEVAREMHRLRMQMYRGLIAAILIVAVAVSLIVLTLCNADDIDYWQGTTEDSTVVERPAQLTNN